MSQAEAKGVRTPGAPPNIVSHVRTAQGAIERLPVELRAPMRAILEPLLAFAQQQDTFNRRSRARYLSLPSPHGATHLGGNDNIVSLNSPAALTPDSEGDAGTPQGGVSAGDHTHDMSAFADLGELADLLGDAIPVADDPVRRLLEAALLELVQLDDLLAAWPPFSSSVTLTVTLSSDQNNYMPGPADLYRLEADAAHTITGFASKVLPGAKITVYNIGSFDITLSHESAASSPANRFACSGAADILMAPATGAHALYDGVSLRWRIHAI